MYYITMIVCMFPHMPKTELSQGRDCIYVLFQPRPCNWKKSEMLLFDLNDQLGFCLGHSLGSKLIGGVF